MELTKEANEVVLKSNKFLGYGEFVNSKIFFFGSEEKGDFTNIYEFNEWAKPENTRQRNTFIEINGNTYFYQTENKDRIETNAKNTKGTQAKLAYKLLKEIFGINNLPTLEEYLESFYIKEEKRVFCSNVFPLGADGEKELSNLHKELGFTTKEECYEYAWEYSRKKVMRNLIVYLTNKINAGEDIYIFHFGAITYNKLKLFYEELQFKFDDSKIRNVKKNSTCRRIWFCSHPAAWGNSKFKQEDSKQIIQFIQSSKS